MSQNWLHTLLNLKAYVSSHPDIEVSSNAICIPADKRPGFYNLFNAVCLEFLSEHFPAFLEQGSRLHQAWTVASLALRDTLNLNDIKVPAGTKWFLLDPADGLVRVLIDPLFDVLKGKQDPASFEKVGTALVADVFRKFFKEGYRLWAAVALMRAISADRAYQVPVTDYYDPSIADMTDLRPGTHKENVASPRETNKMVSEQVPLCTFLVPALIVHSTRLGSYAAFRDNFCEARWQARTFSPAQEWLSVSEITGEFGQADLWPDLAIYLNPDLKELNLVADYYQVARPDVVLEFKEDPDWYEKEGLQSVKRHYNVLKPRLGSFVICREPPGPSALDEAKLVAAAPAGSVSGVNYQQGPGIQLLYVGYDPSRLDAVIRALEGCPQS